MQVLYEVFYATSQVNSRESDGILPERTC